MISSWSFPTDPETNTEVTGDGVTGSLPPLRESPELSGGGGLSLAALMSSGASGALTKDSPKSGTTFLTEGIPPLSSRLVERIQAWQYVELAELLTDGTAKTEEPLPQAMDGQVLLVQSIDQVKRRKKKITDVATWAQAFSIYAAALASAESTSKAEVTGLMAHQHVILQMHKDLGGMRWLQYDQQYREWAAATKKRVWGETNLTIYGRCLCAPVSSPVPSIPTRQPAVYGKKGAAKKGKVKNRACFKHNFEELCPRKEEECWFDHVCWHCGTADHVAGECPNTPKRPRS